MNIGVGTYDGPNCGESEVEIKYKVSKSVTYKVIEEGSNYDNYPRVEISEKEGQIPILESQGLIIPLIDGLSTEQIVTLFSEREYSDYKSTNFLKKLNLLIKTYRNEL